MTVRVISGRLVVEVGAWLLIVHEGAEARWWGPGACINRAADDAQPLGSTSFRAACRSIENPRVGGSIPSLGTATTPFVFLAIRAPVRGVLQAADDRRGGGRGGSNSNIREREGARPRPLDRVEHLRGAPKADEHRAALAIVVDRATKQVDAIIHDEKAVVDLRLTLQHTDLDRLHPKIAHQLLRHPFESLCCFVCSRAEAFASLEDPHGGWSRIPVRVPADVQ